MMYCAPRRLQSVLTLAATLIALTAVGCGPDSSSGGSSGDPAIVAAGNGTYVYTPSTANPSSGSQGSGGAPLGPAFVTNPSAPTVVAGDIVFNPATPPTGNEPPDDDVSVEPNVPDDPVYIEPNVLPTEPILWAHTSELHYNVAVSQLELRLRNVGIGSLSYTVADNADWLSVSPASGMLSSEEDTIIVTVNRAWLVDPYTVYEAVLTVSSPQSSALVVEVSVEVPPPSIRPAVSHPTIDFGMYDYQVVLQLWNQDPYYSSYAISASEPWLELSRLGGGLSPAPDYETIYVSVTRCQVEWVAGHYTCEVYIDATGAERITIPVHVEVPAAPSDAVVASWLAPLPPLPKRMISYSFQPRLLDDPNNPLTYEWVRLTRSITLESVGTSAERVRNAIAVAKRVSQNSPGLPIQLTTKHSPYQYHLTWGDPPTPTTPAITEGVAYASACMQDIKTKVDLANAYHGTNFQMTHVILNTELWRAKDPNDPNIVGAAAWNEILRGRYDDIYNVCKAAFPNADVDWYNRGKPYTDGAYFALNEQGESCSQDVYVSWDVDKARERYGQGYWFSQQIGEIPIPFLSFAGGFYNNFPDQQWRAVCNLQYSTAVSWELGRIINDPNYVPPAGHNPSLQVAELLGYYTGPGDPRSPDMWKHFRAFCQGAAGIPEN